MTGGSRDKHPRGEIVLHDRCLIKGSDIVGVRFWQLLQIVVDFRLRPQVGPPAKNGIDSRPSALTILNVFPTWTLGGDVTGIIEPPKIRVTALRGMLVLVLEPQSVTEFVEENTLPILWTLEVEATKVQRTLVRCAPVAVVAQCWVSAICTDQ